MKIKNKLMILILVIVAFLTFVMTIMYSAISSIQNSVSNSLIEDMTNEVKVLTSEESARTYEAIGETIIQKEINVVEQVVTYISGRMVLQANYLEQQYLNEDDEEQILEMADAVWDGFNGYRSLLINTYIVNSDGKVITLTGPELSEKADESINADYMLGASGYGMPIVGKVTTDKSGTDYCSISASYNNDDGELAGVIVSRIPLSVFESSLSGSEIGNNGKSLMILDEERYVTGENLDDSVTSSTEWKQLIQNAMDNHNGSEWVTLGKEQYYALYRQSPQTDWILCTFISKEDIDRQTDEVISKIGETSTKMQSNLSTLNYTYLKMILIASIILALIAMCIAYRLSKGFVRPINNLLTGVKKMETGDLEVTVEPTSKDEIGELTKAYNGMTFALKRQMEEIKTMTAKEEKTKAEMGLAAKIQRGMLPSTKLNDEYVEAEGYNKPAKDLGGDFYDHFYIDDNHVAIIIADVSDKGIPAALFMTNGRLLLHESYREYSDVAERLITVNDILSRNNENLQFITAFICIVDIRTGQTDYLNAGHELPLLRKSDGNLVSIEADSGIPLGLMEGFAYEAGKINIGVGDTMFMYTDGVEDCVNLAGEHYSNQRMMEAIKGLKGNMIDGMLSELTAYSEGADPFDDITMLSFTLKKLKG